MKVWDVLVIGGGAGGFFSAINIKERNPALSVLILEKDKDLLKKVRISGGGRCNVTHACFDPMELSTFYPRGEKALRGPFHRFCTGDMMAWLSDRGVETHIEEDNRVFPVTNNSQTIIDLFLQRANDLGIAIKTRCRVDSIAKDEHWVIESGKEEYQAKNLIVATGSNPKMWKMLHRDLGHSIVQPVPSLFTFNIKDERIAHLPGVSVPHATVTLADGNLATNGPLLITHWGLSGPAILKLSARGAFALHAKKYRFTIGVNWLGGEPTEACKQRFVLEKRKNGKQGLQQANLYALPKRLWISLLESAVGNIKKNLADLSKQELHKVALALTHCTLSVHGKSTFKEEFVTAGGVELDEVDFKTFGSKLHKNLYFVGEVLNIDAVTGGFNFQNCWTGGYILAESICS